MPWHLVRLGEVNDPPGDRRWAGVLLLCGNLGLGGTWAGSRRLLARLAELVLPGAVLIGDSVTPDGPPAVLLRIRYQIWSRPGGRGTTSRPGRWDDLVLRPCLPGRPVVPGKLLAPPQPGQWSE
jgi:hypothetical protein